MANKYDKKFLEKLAKKIIDGKATEAEKLFLNEYYQAFEKEPEISAQLSDQQKDILKDEIKHALMDRLDTPQGSVVPFYKKTITRIAAAASILLCCSIGFYYYHHHKQKTETNLLLTKNDIAPGSNKAVLTLANGKSIILTGAKNGILARQGNAFINKTADGDVSYKSSQSGPLISGSQSEIQYNTMTTPRGGQYHLTLADGTNVWLNSASSIRYPTAFNGNERRVEITGEAYFEVTHNAARPFRVTTKNQTVEDLGTHFNINSYPDEPAVKTTLLEGSVKVTKGTESAFLKPGQQSINNLSTSKIRVINNANIEESVAWKNGYFLFDGENIESIMRKVSRWYDVEVVYQNGVPDVALGGSISRFKNVSQLLDVLERTGSVHFKLEGRRLTVMK
jgi:transmembrane sensor